MARHIGQRLVLAGRVDEHEFLELAFRREAAGSLPDECVLVVPGYLGAGRVEEHAEGLVDGQPEPLRGVGGLGDFECAEALLAGDRPEHLLDCREGACRAVCREDQGSHQLGLGCTAPTLRAADEAVVEERGCHSHCRGGLARRDLGVGEPPVKLDRPSGGAVG